MWLLGFCLFFENDWTYVKKKKKITQKMKIKKDYCHMNSKATMVFTLHIRCGVFRLCCLFPIWCFAEHIAQLCDGWQYWLEKLVPQDLISEFATQTLKQMGLGLVLSALLALLNNLVPVHKPSQIAVKEKAPQTKTEAFPREGPGVGWTCDWSKCMQI